MVRMAEPGPSGPQELGGASARVGYYRRPNAPGPGRRLEAAGESAWVPIYWRWIPDCVHKCVHIAKVEVMSVEKSSTNSNASRLIRNFSIIAHVVKPGEHPWLRVLPCSSC